MITITKSILLQLCGEGHDWKLGSYNRVRCRNCEAKLFWKKLEWQEVGTGNVFKKSCAQVKMDSALG